MAAANLTAPTRVQVQLPLQRGLKEQWENLGITWGKTSKRSIGGMGILPTGWSLQNTAENNLQTRSFTILDSKETPRATVKIKIDTMPQEVSVHFYSVAEEPDTSPKSQDSASETDDSSDDEAISETDRLLLAMHLGGWGY